MDHDDEAKRRLLARQDLSPNVKEGLVKRFLWHPQYKGMMHFQVFDQIKADLIRDQEMSTIASNLKSVPRGSDQEATIRRLNDKWSQFDPKWTTANPGDLATTVTTFELAHELRQRPLVYSAWKAEWDRHEPTNWTEWIWSHGEAIWNGGARFGQLTVTPDSELVSFTYCISLVLFSTRRSTPFLLVGSRSERTARRRCLITSLLLGWWGIQWGPIFTIQALDSLSKGGGKRIRVRDLFKTTDKSHATA